MGKQTSPRGAGAVLWAFLAAFVLAVAGHVGASDDCDGVMSALVAAQRDAQDQMGIVDALETYIASPQWNPTADGWMIEAHSDAIDDLIEYLNTASIAEERAHAAHCY